MTASLVLKLNIVKLIVKSIADSLFQVFPVHSSFSSSGLISYVSNLEAPSHLILMKYIFVVIHLILANVFLTVYLHFKTPSLSILFGSGSLGHQPSFLPVLSYMGSFKPLLVFPDILEARSISPILYLHIF